MGMHGIRKWMICVVSQFSWSGEKCAWQHGVSTCTITDGNCGRLRIGMTSKKICHPLKVVLPTYWKKKAENEEGKVCREDSGSQDHVRAAISCACPRILVTEY